MLIDTIELFEEYIPLSQGFTKIDRLRSYLRQAQQDYLYRFVGKKMVLDIQANPDAFDADLVDCLRRSLAHFAFYLYAPFGNIQFTDAGWLQAKTETQQGATSSAIEEAQLRLIQVGYSELEKVLRILDAGSNEAKYEAFRQSEAYTQLSTCLFRDLATYASYEPSVRSLRLFSLLKASLMDVQQTYIQQTITESLLNRLLANPLDLKTKILLKNGLGKALAKLALSDALPSLAMSIGEYDTILLFDNTTAGTTKGKKSAPSGQIDALAETLHKQGEAALTQAVAFIQANPIDYPEYPVSPTISADYGVQNDPSWGLYAFM
ncbi:DUF6712 family protein [Siphonobacter sp. SORGH_AS_0500]|uniref:DUF6712 family protein n=1 Tax=Siphonobacter sp. SORGH_AS_0500 TaxID=1864824 RepID=UPI00285D04D5|nr:DUF6712 family protein [Siphonobacter sp. SORGH_AS_0500]MDR6196146.1 hypothetical protein [Siphonobacter sp. SORGH_AS_0500]